MFHKILFSILLMAAVSNAAVNELIPKLTSDNQDVQTKARLELLAVCAEASAPDAAAGRREDVSVELCGALAKKQPVVEVTLPLLENLERVGGAEAVPTLTKLLANGDERVRDAARRALSANPAPEAGRALAVPLKTRKARDPREVAGLIVALGERGDQGASNLIAGYVGHKDDRVFLAAVRALGRLGEDAGIKALASQRARENGFRKTQVDAALFATTNMMVFEKLLADKDPNVRATATMGVILGGDMDLAARAIKASDAAQRVAVIEAAAQKKDEALYQIVAEGLGGLPSALQLQALGALEFSGNSSCAPAVASLLKSDDAATRDAAAQALGRIGNADSVAPLLAAGSPAAKRALGMLNVDGVDAALEKRAAAASSPSMRAAAIEALANRGRADLIPAFFKFGASDERAVASAAVKAIGSLGDASNIEALTKLMIERETAPVSRDALNAIVDILRATAEPAGAVATMVGKLDSASPRSQANILKALAQTGLPEALPPLKDACGSSDKALRAAAIKMLGGWPDVGGIPAMLELAADDSLTMAEHVTLMRGVSRLYAAQSTRRLRKAEVQKAIDVCRREEEREALRATQNRLRR